MPWFFLGSVTDNFFWFAPWMVSTDLRKAFDQIEYEGKIRCLQPFLNKGFQKNAFNGFFTFTRINLAVLKVACLFQFKQSAVLRGPGPCFAQCWVGRCHVVMEATWPIMDCMSVFLTVYQYSLFWLQTDLCKNRSQVGHAGYKVRQISTHRFAFQFLENIF